MTTHPAANQTPAPDVAAALRIILDHCAAAAMEAGASSVIIHCTHMRDGSAYRISKSAGNAYAHDAAHRQWLEGAE